jgi:gamma-glutamylputrescine oxidase
VEVTGFENTGSMIEVRTRSGISFTTRNFLICTNASARDLLPDADVTPARGQVILTSPIENLGWSGTFHSDEGYFYFRNVGNRVLLGGARNKAFEDEATTEQVTSPFIQQELEKYLDKVVLPGHRGRYSIEHRWAGIMGMGSDKFPDIREVQPNVVSMVNTGGIGVALAPIAGRKVASLLL